MTLILQDDHLTTGAWATCDPFYYDNLSDNPYCVKTKCLIQTDSKPAISYLSKESLQKLRG